MMQGFFSNDLESFPDSEAVGGGDPQTPLSGDEYHLSVANQQSFVSIDETRILQIARLVLQEETITHAEISIAFVDDDAIHGINRDYLKHDWPTDVITFSLAEEDASGLDGEIVISGETAAREAGDAGWSPEDELGLYLVHGLLHLCGYDDQKPEDRDRMELRQTALLQKFGIRPN